MKIIHIPGLGDLRIEHLVIDYNGTLAVDGKMVEGAIDRLEKLSQNYKIHIVTADTYGTVEAECEGLNVNLKTFRTDDAATYKRKVVESLGVKNSICIGNGYNDIEMFKVAGLSICTLQKEGASGKLFLYSDIVTNSIIDALDIILDTQKIKATLRG